MGVVRIAVDAMGGDFAPAEIVRGAVEGARLLDMAILLVGDPDLIESHLSSLVTQDLMVDIVPASEVISMAERPAQAVRDRADASINVACRQVVEGRADGVLTMGHTGAGMIAALLNFGRIPGVERPAALVPYLGWRKDLFLLDVGANSDVKPAQLQQFAHMGSAYAELAGGIPQPKIGLLSNGSEATKGNQIGRSAFAMLQQDQGIRFVGNIEANQLLTGEANVVVSDGFAGNILLKTTEGLLTGFLQEVKEVLPELPAGAAARLLAHLENLGTRHDYATYGVAVLLGVQHPMFIGHGRSQAPAVCNGLATAKQMITSQVLDRIRAALA